MPNSPETLGERILLARRRARLTQGELAEKIGVSAPDVSRWEHDHRTPRLNHLALIRDVTGDDDVLDLRGVVIPPQKDERPTTQQGEHGPDLHQCAA